MKIASRKWKEIFKVVFVVLVVYVLLTAILVPLLNSPDFKAFVVRIGPLGYLVIIIYTVFAHIFAPLTGTPGMLLGITTYGIGTGLVLLYTAGLISSTINFYISRKYGRKLVTRFVGAKAMQEVDEFTKLEGRKFFILGRLFGFTMFDFISYAGGLTNISFRDYFVITASVALFVDIIIYLIFKDLDFQSGRGITIWLGSITASGIISLFLIRDYMKRRKRREQRI